LKQVGIFYGSFTGDTEKAALLIREKIRGKKVDLYNIIDSCAEDFNPYSMIIMGVSTWGVGILQDDWMNFIPELNRSDLTGKKIALYGLGDQESYPETFADGLGILHDFLVTKGCEIVGNWDPSGYRYTKSKAISKGMFVGLVLDEKNQPELTEERISRWISVLGL